MSTRPDPERDAQLLEQLDAETARLLFPERFSGPVEICLVFPALPDEAAAEAAAALETATTSAGPEGRVRASFGVADVDALHELYALLDRHVDPAAVEILLDGKKLPLSRELWLPLLWNLRS